ncbi:dihydropyrimidinase [uncultured Cetobacterium sp.]|uniref:dihydropyrimidinase n=1 Tax=uncultured Cetobacterium sp. TaxID=527638 RepID=UPI00261FBA8A|nr:dihydropyrimidinase [uncultured Cetobacterium sp.]
MNILLKNGFLLTENGLEKSDIHISDSKIKQVSKNIVISEAIDKTFDFSNKFIIPGGIDVHTHLNIDVGTKSIDNFVSGGYAAIFGGTTTIIDHPGFGPDKCPLDFQIDLYMENAKASPIDYSFHGVIQHIHFDMEQQMKKLKSKGITSFKLYMTYTYLMNDLDVLKVFEIAKNLDLTIAVHAENHGIIEFLKNKFKYEKKLSAIYHAKSRPDYSESEAVQRLLFLSKTVNFNKLYFVHISCKKSLDILSKAKNDGQTFFVESCPQYLLLNENKYLEEDGNLYIMSPPLRKKEDNVAIIDGITKGLIDVIGTDHCSFSLTDKNSGKLDFTKCPNGAPGIEERIPLMFSEFLKGNITAKSFLNSCCLNPAKIFGLYPQKGTLSPQGDADIVVLSLENFNFENPKSKAMYSCFKDITSLARVHSVFIRGNIVLDEYKLIENAYTGVFLPRK